MIHPYVPKSTCQATWSDSGTGHTHGGSDGTFEVWPWAGKGQVCGCTKTQPGRALPPPLTLHGQKSEYIS